MNSFNWFNIQVTSLFAVLAIFSNVNASQPIVQARYSNTLSFPSSEIWNIDIISSESKEVSVIMEVSISDEKGNEVIEFNANSFILRPGVNSLNSWQISWTRIYYSKGFEEVEKILGGLPSGAYQICYYLRCSKIDCDGLGENALSSESPQCHPLQVEPPTPLLLSSPFDQSIIQWPRPDFHWIPPMPLSGVAGFNYTMELYSIKGNQTCQEVASLSRPLFRLNGLNTNWSNYPSDMSNLDTGIKYCWNVSGWLEGNKVAQSEVWEFELEKPEKIKKDTFWYYELKQTPDAHVVLLKEEENLYFICKDFSPNQDLQIRIYDELWNLSSSQVVKISNDTFNKVVVLDNIKRYGENKYSLINPSSYLQKGLGSGCLFRQFVNLI